MPVPKKLVLAVIGGLVALIGLIAAASAGRGSGYIVGLSGFVGGIIFVMAIVKAHFDGKPDTGLPALLPTQPRGAVAALIAMGVLFLAGLFVAAGAEDYYALGLGASAVALVAGFRLLGRLLDLLSVGSRRS